MNEKIELTAEIEEKIISMAKNETLANKMMENTEIVNQIKSIFKESGTDITDEDIKQILKETENILNGKKKLSEKELENIAGGLGEFGKGVITAGATIGGGTATLALSAVIVNSFLNASWKLFVKSKEKSGLVKTLMALPDKILMWGDSKNPDHFGNYMLSGLIMSAAITVAGATTAGIAAHKLQH